MPFAVLKTRNSTIGKDPVSSVASRPGILAPISLKQS